MQLLVDFELFDCDCLDDFETKYDTHVGLVPVGLLVGVEVSKSTGFVNVGFGESVGSDANVGDVGAGLLPLGVGGVVNSPPVGFVG